MVIYTWAVRPTPREKTTLNFEPGSIPRIGMPSAEHFSFSVLIGGVAVPEYYKDGKTYIESNLYTPVSYDREEREQVGDELEVQKWPVTPYQVLVRSGPLTEKSCYRLYIDGVKVGGVVLENGQSKWAMVYCERLYKVDCSWHGYFTREEHYSIRNGCKNPTQLRCLGC